MGYEVNLIYVLLGMASFLMMAAGTLYGLRLKEPLRRGRWHYIGHAPFVILTSYLSVLLPLLGAGLYAFNETFEPIRSQFLIGLAGLGFILSFLLSRKLFYRIRWNNQCLEEFRPFGRSRRFYWQKIQKTNSLRRAGFYDLTDKDGRVLFIPVSFAGVDTLMQSITLAVTAKQAGRDAARATHFLMGA